MKHSVNSFLVFVTLATAAIVSCADGSASSRPEESTWLVWTVKTTGTDLDPNGFTVIIDSSQTVPVSINATDSVRVAAGAHILRLGGVGSNCAVSGTNPSTTRVETGQHIAVAWAVSCKFRQIAATMDTAGAIRIAVLDRNGQNQFLVPDVPGAEYVDSWSPDGTTLLYSNIANDNTDLWRTEPDGSNRARLTNTPVTNHGGSWSPDGRLIAFHARRTTAAAQVYLMNADGSNQHAVTDGTVADIYPRWSPDGTRLVLYEQRATDFQVLTMNPDGTDRRYLTPLALRAAEPTWSPDGQRIAFTGSPQSGSFVPRELYVMNADGSNIRQLTNAGRSVASPDWSPDGQFILFTEQATSALMRLSLYSVADATTQALPFTSRQILYPTWRP